MSGGIVNYGSTERTGGKTATFNKESIIQHPEFEFKTLANDISLIKVSLKLDGSAVAIALPPRSSSYDTFADNFALISGYGSTTFYSKLISVQFM